MPAKRTSLQDRVQKDRMSRAISAFVSTPVAGEEPEYPSDETAAVAETAGPVGATGATGPTEPTGAAAPVGAIGPTRPVETASRPKQRLVSTERNIIIGGRKYSTIYYDTDIVKRQAYHLRESTIEKIALVTKMSGMKKAEFVDFLLSCALDEILEGEQNLSTDL